MSTNRNWLFRLLLACSVLTASIVLPLPAQGQGQEQGICGRAPGIYEPIVAAIEEVTRCEDVLPEQLATVTSLDLDYTVPGARRLERLLERDFVGLSGLTSLRVNGQDFSKFGGTFEFRINEIFKHARNLETLRITNSRLTSAELHPYIFLPLTKLKTLDLSGNSLHHLSPAMVANLESLEHLNLDDNNYVDYYTAYADRGIAVLLQRGLQTFSMKDNGISISFLYKIVQTGTTGTATTRTATLELRLVGNDPRPTLLEEVVIPPPCVARQHAYYSISDRGGRAVRHIHYTQYALHSDLTALRLASRYCADSHSSDH